MHNEKKYALIYYLKKFRITISFLILGFADAYIISKGTTFKWDTCAPHSILKSLGGDVVDFKNTIENIKTPIVYSSDQSNCNSNGLIAYRNEEILNHLIELLKK